LPTPTPNLTKYITISSPVSETPSAENKGIQAIPLVTFDDEEPVKKAQGASNLATVLSLHNSIKWERRRRGSHDDVLARPRKFIIDVEETKREYMPYHQCLPAYFFPFAIAFETEC
jgi:hypothetical protein